MQNVLNFIIAFGALQGLIIGILLLVKSFKLRQENSYLALIFIGFAAMLGRVIILSIYENQSSFFINLNFILLISPAFYVYSYEASDDTKYHLKFKHLHFLPFFSVNSGYILFYFVFQDSVDYQTYLSNIIRINEGLSIAYFSIYLFFTYRIIKLQKAFYSILLRKLLIQLEFLFLGFFIVWFSYVVAEWVYFNYSIELLYYYPMMLILAVILYYMSLKVYLPPQFLFDSKVFVRRKTFILEESESKKLLNQLTLLMNDEKPFLDGNLSLISLANSLDVNPKTLSFVINEHLQKNFNAYINDWRIEEVKQRLNDKTYGHLKMISIAFDCGFNSKSTFNLAFKKSTGLSPSEFRNS